MACIQKRDNGNYLVRISMGYDSQGKQILKSKTFRPSSKRLPPASLKRELKDFVSEFEKEVKSSGLSAKSNLTFEEFCDEFIRIKAEALSPNTMVFYEKVIYRELIPMFGKMRIQDFKVFHVQQFIQYLSARKRFDEKGKNIAGSTVKRYTTVLRSILSLAYKMEYTDNDISNSRRLVFPAYQVPEVEVYTLEEVGQILEALMDEPINIRALIEIALFTGLRRAEIVGLKWTDIDLAGKRLSVKRSIYKPKDGKALEKEPKSMCSIRTISIPDKLCETLKEYRENQERHASFMGRAWHENGYVFTEIDGLVMNPQTPTKQFSHFLKRHGIRHLKFHGLRHTSATLLLAKGCDIKTVSTRLGHSDIDTTNIYVHALESTDRAAADLFDKMVMERQSK